MEFTDLVTERLQLKSIGMEDAEFILNHFAEDSVSHYLYDAEPYQSIEEAEELINFYLEPMPRGQHRWILVSKDSEEKIGTCGFHCWNYETGEIEIGYDLNEKYRGKGYMSEALKAILKFAKDTMKVKTIRAQIYPENTASVKLAERMGFTYHGNDETLIFRGKEYLHHMYELSF